MDNFKIIGIRTGDMEPFKSSKGEKSHLLNPLRNLAKNQIYQLRNEYKFLKDDFTEIKYEHERDINLYQLTTETNHIPININAIVGSNGSGKSTLIELLYWGNYNIGSALNLLEDEDGNKKRPFRNLDFELLYSINRNVIIKISFSEGRVYKQCYKQENNIFIYSGDQTQVKDIKELSEFFYTIVVNYSHYALNSLEIGDWIVPLFHKNDGYQTPIVLNPMRDKGDIDINKEKHLLSRRLIANILEDVKEGEEQTSLRNMVNGKIAKDLVLTYNPNPNYNLEEPIDPEIRTRLVKAFNQYFKFEITDKELNDSFFVTITLAYIFKKLIKMVEYTSFRRYKNKKSQFPAIKDINAFIKRIHSSNSHLVFKVKGAILYLKHYKKIFTEDIGNLSKQFTLSVQELSGSIKGVKEEELFMVNTYMMVPPSFYDINIIPTDGSQFVSFSSGEKQKIHSISSIVYHLINLNSVEQWKEDSKSKISETEDMVRYNFINIILDEIELYYHPDWQRTYIADMIDYIGKISPDNLRYIKGLNITFLTHSPYILSDIPESFVLKLHNGLPAPSSKGESTFGSNIHDLLANDFFMKNGFMGEWAKRQIEETIKYLNLRQCEKEIIELEKKDKLIKEEQLYLDVLNKEKDSLRSQEFKGDFTYYEKIVELIGEPVIKNKIKTMYADLLEDSERKRIAKRQIQQIAKDAGLQVDLN